LVAVIQIDVAILKKLRGVDIPEQRTKLMREKRTFINHTEATTRMRLLLLVLEEIRAAVDAMASRPPSTPMATMSAY
jgi:hypothetical protein